MNAAPLIDHRRQTAPGLWPVILTAVLVIISLAVMLDHLPRAAGPVSDHAVAQHGQDAEKAAQCGSGQQAGYLFWNPQTHRWALACWLGDRWGIVILTAAWLVVTAWVTTKLKDEKQMRAYMKRRGYEEQ